MAKAQAEASASSVLFNGTNDTPKQQASSIPQDKPRLLIMGMKRSGKSSISNVVFRKMPPHETLFLETTTSVRKETMHSFMDFQVWDMPGQIDYLESGDNVFDGVGSIIWVLDAVDNYMEPVGRLTNTILQLQDSFPDIKYSVFIHKVDSLTEDYREDTVRDITQRITDELFDAGLENPAITYYGTSIYDHTIFEAFSRVMQGLTKEMPYLEALLNTLSANCRFEKAYLFDIYSKIYVASDSTPFNSKAYELCSDFIDIIVDLSEVYGWIRDKNDPQAAPAKGIVAESAESFVTNIKGFHLYLREINRTLAFIAISKDPNFEAGKVLIDQNVQMFQNTVLEVMKLTRGSSDF